jgi:hypothetical protein
VLHRSISSTYEDDGLSFEYRNGNYALRTIDLQMKDGHTQVTIGKVEGAYRFKNRGVVVKLVGLTKPPVVVEVSGSALPALGEAGFENAANGWKVDKNTGIVWIKLRDSMSQQVLSVR